MAAMGVGAPCRPRSWGHRKTSQGHPVEPSGDPPQAQAARVPDTGPGSRSTGAQHTEKEGRRTRPGGHLPAASPRSSPERPRPSPAGPRGVSPTRQRAAGPGSCGTQPGPLLGRALGPGTGPPWRAAAMKEARCEPGLLPRVPAGLRASSVPSSKSLPSGSFPLLRKQNPISQAYEALRGLAQAHPAPWLPQRATSAAA